MQKKLEDAGKRLFEAGANSMSYYDDNWCPTIPKPHFESPEAESWRFILNGPEVMLNPQPLPPRLHPYYGAILTFLANAVSVEDISATLSNIGASLMNESA